MTFGKTITLLGSDQPPRTVQNKTVKDSEGEGGEWQQERQDRMENTQRHGREAENIRAVPLSALRSTVKG